MAKLLPIRKIGSKGKLVKKLQENLNAQTDIKLEVDGVYGKATEDAVRRYQKKHNLGVDGIAGPKVFDSLGIKIELNPKRNRIETPQWTPGRRPFEPSILIIKGGGIKGIAYAGALEVLEKYGYEFDHFVGTSAGAITAALLATNHSTEDIRKILSQTDFKKFKDGSLLISLLLLPFRKGLYPGKTFQKWMESCLRTRFPELQRTVPIRFKHLRTLGRRLTIFTSVKGKSGFSFDSRKNSPTAEETISFACRCSMAIPYLFTPQRIGGQWAIDGGAQNNYPVVALREFFRDLGVVPSDFLGLYLGSKNADDDDSKLFFPDVFKILTDSRDEETKEKFIDRTIVIDPSPIKTADFSLTLKEIEFLIAEGKASALRWLREWADGTRPLEEEVLTAESQANELRNEVIAARY